MKSKLIKYGLVVVGSLPGYLMFGWGTDSFISRAGISYTLLGLLGLSGFLALTALWIKKAYPDFWREERLAHYFNLVVGLFLGLCLLSLFFEFV
jgi:hypothetical protein